MRWLGPTTTQGLSGRTHLVCSDWSQIGADVLVEGALRTDGADFIADFRVWDFASCGQKLRKRFTQTPSAHAPLLAQMQPGVMEFHNKETVQLLSVSGGFVEIFEGKVTILAETAEMADEVDSERARLAVERARASMAPGAKTEGTDPDQVRASLIRALARLKVVEIARRKFPRKSPPAGE